MILEDRTLEDQPGWAGDCLESRAYFGMGFDSSFFLMDTTDKGRLGEVKVLSRLTELGWYPFVDLSGKCPVDCLAWKGGIVKKIQVKCCDYSPRIGIYEVQIGSIRPNRTGNTIKKFDNTTVDYLAVYFPTPDKVCFFESKGIMTGRVLNVNVLDMDTFNMLR